MPAPLPATPLGLAPPSLEKKESRSGKRAVIALTMGDPGGIGPEIILKSLGSTFPKNVTPLVIGSELVFRYASKRLSIPFHPRIVHDLREIATPDVRGGKSPTCYLLDVTREAELIYKRIFGKVPQTKDKSLVVGRVSKWNACLAYGSLASAAQAATRGDLGGIVTAPVHKAGIRLVAPRFSGHTEYLAKIDHAREFAMMFVSSRLRVTLATIHLPLKDVARSLDQNSIISKIRLTNDFLKALVGIRMPKIGVAALNPHGREFGVEENRVIAPAVRASAKMGIRVEGPLSGDQVFHEAYEGRLDAVIAMYHDQGLAPFKMIAFRDGVNVTLGLSYLRTSPDHGTAFDIAYQNKAFPTAFIHSIRLVSRSIDAGQRYRPNV